jgi:hypothetical protein
MVIEFLATFSAPVTALKLRNVGSPGVCIPSLHHRPVLAPLTGTQNSLLGGRVFRLTRPAHRDVSNTIRTAYWQVSARRAQQFAVFQLGANRAALPFIGLP